ncbi:tripartite motif-containing protein 3-like [Ptychodera flava]|uniref:tripartite motif-containing protein 3-like n=1 Tax=Ptychodera flava TaxID=63121 RepID=UPI003969ECEC
MTIRNPEGKVVTPLVEVVAKLQTPDRPADIIQAVDNRNGTQTLTVYGETEGKYRLEITMAGKPIPGSPFKFQWSRDWSRDWAHSALGKCFCPCDVAVSDNLLFSLDVNNKQVIVSDENGHRIRCFGQNELKKPKAIAISPLDGSVYVTDRAYNNSYIRIYSQDGSFARSIKFRGKPTDCCFNSEGILYVTDKTVLDYQGVKVFDSNSRYLRKIRDIGKVPLFNNPRGVAVDEDGYIYVCDEHRIMKLSSTGDFVCRIDSRNDGLSYPSGIVVTRTSPKKLVVADKGNHCIKVYVL